MKKNRKVTISFTAEPELVDYLNRMAEADHTTVSQYIRNVLLTGLSLEDYRNEYQKNYNYKLKELLESKKYSEDELITKVVDNINEF